MGNASSNDGLSWTSGAVLSRYYDEAIKSMGNVTRTGGGCGCVGGTKDIQDYENSIYSKGKENLIRKMAAKIFDAMQFKTKVNPEKDDIDVIVKTLHKALPDPRSQQIGKGHGLQQGLVDELVKIVNEIGGDVISMSDSTDSKVAKISEIIYALTRDINTEFMNVAGDLEQSVKNLDLLMAYLKAAQNKMLEVAGRSGDSTIQAQVESVKGFYDILMQETNRQLMILASMISGVVGPTKGSIIGLLEESNEFKGMVAKIKAAVGTDEYGSRLGYLLAGVDVLGQAAARVQKALKKVGMEPQVYAAAKDMGELRTKIYEHAGKGKGPLSTKELGELIAAVEILRDNNYAHDEIAAILTKRGGAIGDEFSSKIVQENSLGKRIERQSKFREQLFKDFNDNLLVAYRRIVAAAAGIGPKIGDTIPISNELADFIKAFSEMDMADRENFHIVLTGYMRDASSRDLSNRFLSSINVLHHHLEKLQATKNAAEFREMNDAIMNLKTLVTDFSTKFLSAITEVAAPPREKKTGGDGELKEDAMAEVAALGEHIEGKARDFIQRNMRSLGGGDKEKYYVTIKTAQKKLAYYYRLATVKGDLARTSEDLKLYGEKYEVLLGESMAARIDAVEKAYDTAVKELDWGVDDTPKNVTYSTAKTLGDHFSLYIRFANSVNGAAPSADEMKVRLQQVKDWEEMLKTYYNDRRNAMKNLYKVAQAVDLYLKGFAQSHAAHPDEVRDLASLLENTLMAAQWFAGTSGNHIASLFEDFPAELLSEVEIPSNGRIDPATGSYSTRPAYNTAGPHYYEYIAENVREGLFPGNPFLAKLLLNKKKYEEFKEKITKAVGAARALDNIVNAFVNVGSKFTGKALEKETFMGGGLMFKTLMEYWVMSSFTCGFSLENMSTLKRSEIKTIESKAGENDHQIGVAATVNRDGAHAPLQFIKANAAVVSNAPGRIAKDGSVIPFIDARDVTASALNLQSLGTPATGFPMGVSSRTTVGDNPSSYVNIRKRIGMALTSHVDTGFANPFKETDSLFVMIIQAMAAKIIVVTKTFAMFHRPSSANYTALTPFRMILGGGSAMEEVEIIPEAVELYIRVPLLLEWYRGVLSYKANRDAAKSFMIAMIPDTTSVWADLFVMIFEKTDFIKDGTYAESDIRAIIRAINKVYAAYKEKDAEATIRAVIGGMITEINQRYGFAKREDMDKWNEERQKTLTGIEVGPANERIDYDITDSKNAWSARPAPSDQFTNFRSFDPKVSTLWTQEVKKTVDDFREKIMKDLDTFGEKSPGVPAISFSEAIKNTKSSIKSTKSSEEQFQIVMRAMQGLSKFGNFKTEYALMFEETVATPLAILKSVWDLLSAFNTYAQSNEYSVIWSIIKENATGNALTDVQLRDLYIARKKQEVEAKRSKFYINENHLRAMINLTDPDSASNNPLLRAVGSATAGVAGDMNRHPYLIKVTNMHEDVVDTIKHIYTIGTDLGKLCEFNLSSDGDNMLLDFSNLRDVVARMLTSVKYSLNVFRNIYPRQFIEIYERFTPVVTSEFVQATYYDMEEHLLKVLLENRDKNGLAASVEILTSNFKIASTILPDDMLHEKFAELVYWNNTDVPQEKRSDNQTNFPFNIIPRYDNGAGGQPRNEEEKALIKRLTDLKLDKSPQLKIDILTQYRNRLSIMFDNMNLAANIMVALQTSGTLFDNTVAPFVPLDVSMWGYNDDAYYWHLWGRLSQMAPLINDALDLSVAISLEQETISSLNSTDKEYLDNIKNRLYHIYAMCHALITVAKQSLMNDSANVDATIANFNRTFGIAFANCNDVMSHFDTIDFNLVDKLKIRTDYSTHITETITLLYKAFLGAPTATANYGAIDNRNYSFVRIADFMSPTTDEITKLIAKEVVNKLVSERQIDSLLDEYKGSIVRIDNSSVVIREGDTMLHKEKAGLLVRFNEILAHYVALLTSPTSRKIYAPLLNGFARSSSAAIMEGVAINDIDAPARGDPKKGVIVYASVARAIKDLLTAVNPVNNNKIHALDKLTDVDDNMVETMRGTLPWFIRYFNEVRSQAELLKKFVTDSKLKFATPDEYIVAGGFDAVTEEAIKKSQPLLYTGYDYNNAVISHESRKSWYTIMLDNIISASVSLANCASTVYKEIIDTPLYFETSLNSISEYRNQHGRLPLMPLSYSLSVLSGKYDDLNGRLMPVQRSGADGFKYNYGTRKVLADFKDSMKLSYFPSYENSLASFNAATHVDLQLEKGVVEQQLKDEVTLLQWVVSNRSSKVWLNSDVNSSVSVGLDTSSAYWFASECGKQPIAEQEAWALANAMGTPFALKGRNEFSDILNAVQSENSKRNIDDILADWVPETSKLPSDREQSRVANIIELNIVPINIHALMQGVPLANLMNYSYSMQKMVESFMHSKSNVVASFPDDVITKLICNPMVPLNGYEFFVLLPRSLFGDTRKQAGRVKFLSDQIWNKALLQSQYRTNRAAVNRTTNSRNIVFPRSQTIVSVGGPRAEIQLELNVLHDANQETAVPFSPADTLEGLDVIRSAEHSDKDLVYPDSKSEEETFTIKVASLAPNVRDDPANKQTMLKRLLLNMGRLRFETSLMRNMFFVTLLQYVIRLMVVQHRKGIEGPVIDASEIVDERITEYRGAEQFDVNEYD